MKRKYCLLALLWPVVTTHAQNIPQRLDIGETLPDVLLSNLYNASASSARVSKFTQGRYLILDFWDTGCGSCMESMPGTQAIQELHKDRLKILFVNNNRYDTPQKVKLFIENRKRRVGFQLTQPYALNDTVLRKYFPYQYIPHLVWLDPKNKVVAITGKAALTEANLKKFFASQPIDALMKDDDLKYNERYSLLSQLSSDTVIQFYSVLTAAQPSLIGGGRKLLLEGGKATKRYAINYNLYVLIQDAYWDIIKIDPGTVDIQIPLVELTRVYCYEAVMPGTTDSVHLAAMRKDLTNWFGLELILPNENNPSQKAILRSTLFH